MMERVTDHIRREKCNLGDDPTQTTPYEDYLQSCKDLTYEMVRFIYIILKMVLSNS